MIWQEHIVLTATRIRSLIEALMLGQLLALLLALACLSNAQAAGYTPSITTAYPQLAISPSAPQVVWAAGNATGLPSAYVACDDCASKVLPIGFTFTFAGVAYNNWSMSSNGVIFFETVAAGGTSTATAQGTSTYTPVALPTNAFGVQGQPALMPFWADLIKNASKVNVLANNDPTQPANASFFQYQVVTVSGAQVLVIQLKNVGYYAAPSNPVNMQIQLWSTGQIVYSYGTLQILASNALLRIGLQYPGGGCNALANIQSTSLSNQSYLYTWDSAAANCAAIPTVNHYEIRKADTATLCADPVTVLACSVSTSPCPAGNIVSTQIINAAIYVTGVGAATVNISPSSFNIQPSAPLQTVNLTWPSGSSGTATLGLQAAVTASGNLVCTNVAGTVVSANCNVAVSNTACIAPPNHYQIQGPAVGSTCANNTLTIKAWADAAETTAYTAGLTAGTLTQSGNLASIPNLGAFTISAGTSTASITPISFIATGTTTFNTTTTPALAGATTCNFGGSTSCAFVTSSATCVADFNCTETVSNAAVAADSNPGTGRLYTKLAGTAFNFDVMARASSGAVLGAYASDANKTVTVELVDSTSAVACASYPQLSPAVASQQLSFTQANQPTQQGRQSISFTVPNAYKNVRCRATDNNGVKGCSLDNFAIRPPTSTLSTSPAMATPPSAGTANPIEAGATFTLQATASAGTNYTPTLAQDLSKLTAQLTTNVSTQQSGGTVGTLTPSTLVLNAAAVNASYSEVGYLYLAAGALYDASNPSFTLVDSAAGDCVSGGFSDTPVSGKVGCNIGTASAALGRFIPDHFDTAILAGSSPTTPIGCPVGFTCPVNAAPSVSGFVYSNQPFGVQVTAKNAAGGTTTNYQNSFAKATTLSTWNAKGGATANPGGGVMTGASLASTAFANGVASTTTASYGTTLPTLLLPTDVYIRAAEAVGGDSVTSLQVTSNESGLKAASGRINIANMYGSELLPLLLPITVQLYTNTGWITSTTDSTVTFNSALSPTGNLASTKVTGPVNCVSVNNPSIAAVASGVRSISLTAAAACSYSLSLSGMPIYLPIAPTSGARATFGLFKSPLIYRRENY